MTWMQFPHGLRLDPIAKESPEALVVVLHDVGDSAATLTPIAARWAATVPTTAFIALDGIERLDPSSGDLPRHTVASSDPTVLDRAAGHLVPLLEQQLRACRLDASRLVLAGFGYGGTLALHLLLRQGWHCAGVLAFAARLTRPLPRILRVDRKVRLIEYVDDPQVSHGSLRDAVALLAARGIDTRGVLLVGSVLSEESIRHGGAYLVELVATAQQRGDQLSLDREGSHEQ
jgi:predicted esterase